MNIKFELTENLQALVIEDVSTVKPVVTLTTYDDYVFLEEVGQIISVIGKYVKGVDDNE